jgi:hypothetical protein
MRRDRHPDKDIEAAIRYAEALGWRFRKAGGHAFGRLLCPWNDADCRCGEFCQISVWSTPRSAWAHAAQIRRAVDGCMRAQDAEGGS